MQDFSLLLEKFLYESLSSDELTLFLSQAQKPENQETIARAIQEKLSNKAFNGQSGDKDTDQLFLQMMQRAADLEPSSPKVRHLNRRQVWWAAAAIFLLVGTGAWLWSHKPTQPAGKEIARISGDVFPGTNKAVLTLADGTTVALDSIAHQQIRQNGVAINQQGGRLQYVTTGTETVGYNTLSVPRGGLYEIILPDGSHVWLNSASSLRYPTAFTGTDRVVELQGQGYFEIASNSRQPFKVKVNQLEVQVLGTNFDIMAYTDENSVNTTLVQGAVKIVKGSDSQLLQPGEQAVCDKEGARIAVKNVDVNSVIAWKNGLFLFNHAKLDVLLREISRWYDIEVVNEVKGDSRRYSGGIGRNQPLADVLELLEANGINHFKITGRKVTVLP